MTIKITSPSSLNSRPYPWRCMIRAVIGPLGYIIAIVLLAQIMGLRPAAADDIAKAEEWFNSLTTYQADFTQASSDGSHAKGKFSLRRPFRSRFDFDDPVLSH